jgi:hypothetical protein
MIKYALVCEHGHEFEGWFGSSADYDDQEDRKLVTCPLCTSATIRKQIMAPSLSGTKAQKSDPLPSSEQRQAMREVMSQLRSHVEANFDYVGDSFASEARAIHEGTSEQREIFGEAAPSEVRALVADGINVLPLPPKTTDVN